MSSADVVVVGAGLAGMTAAIALADAGASVEVVARGHAATHWTSGGLDVAAPRGVSTPREGVDRLRRLPGHPYANLAADVPAAIARFQAVVAEGGLPYLGDASSPIRAVPTAIGGTRPAAILPAAQSGSLAPWAAEERLVICGFAGFKDFWPEHVASSLTREAVWGASGGGAGAHPMRVEALSIALPGLTGRRNLSALDIARVFDSLDSRRAAIEAITAALARTGSRPGRLGLPAAIGLADHAVAFRELADAIDLLPFEIPLVPPSIPGLRLFAVLRAALRARSGRIVIGEPVADVARDGRRVTAVSMTAATRHRTIRTGGVVLATGGIAGGGLIGTQDGRLVEAVVGLPVEAPPVDDWLAPTPFDPRGHQLETAGIRTDAALRPIDARGNVVFENVTVAGSGLAGMRYLTERCGDGVAITSGLRAAATLGGLSATTAATPAPADSGRRHRKARAEARS
jgi:glycerol-3-phosphate dehydrogenase subunit B